MSVQKINLFEQVSQFYIGSQASIEATTGVQEGSLGYATDINKMGSYNGATWDWAGSGSGGHTIQDEGTPLTARANLNFVGAGVTATDDAGNNATVITVPTPTLFNDAEGDPADTTSGAAADGTSSYAARRDHAHHDATGGGSAHVIQDEGTPLTARANLNFIGGGVTATDNAGANSTDVTIPAGLAFNDAEGNPADDVRSGPADGTSTYAARRDHSHRDNLPPKFINRGTPTWNSSPVNDYDTSGVDEIVAVVGSGTIELTGMVNGVQGNYVYLCSHNISTGNLLLKHLDGRSTVQFRLPGQQDMLISKSEGVLLQLQGATIWVVLGTTSGSLLQGVKVDPDLLGAATTNDVLTYDGSKLTLVAPTGGGHTIQEEGTPLTTRAALNFKGTGITAVDNSGANATDVTVVINETTLTTTDITTGDVSTSKHGLVPKLPNTQYKALRGDGSWGGIADRDGWIQFLEASYAYASASTFTITGDYSSTFRKGLRLLWHDSVGWKWGVVLSSAYGAPNTTVTIFTNTDYVLAASMDFIFWSDAAQPNGFPAYFNYTPTTTSITIGNGAITGRYYVLGSQVFGDYTLTRGSTTSFTGNIAIGYPCTVNQNAYFVSGNVSLVDTATALYTGICLADGTVRCMTTSGAYAVYAYVTSTAPFTWGSGDVIEGSFRYRY